MLRNKSYFYEASTMSEIEMQRLERCKKCSMSKEINNFMGTGENVLFCPLHNYGCDDIIQCVYVSDTKRYMIDDAH